MALATWAGGHLTGVSGHASLGEIVAANLAGVPAAFPVLALQLWISMRFPSVFIPLGIALAGNFLGLLTFSHRVEQWLPCSFPITLMGANGRQGIDFRYVTIACLMGLLFSVAGTWDFQRREVT